MWTMNIHQGITKDGLFAKSGYEIQDRVRNNTRHMTGVKTQLRREYNKKY